MERLIDFDQHWLLYINSHNSSWADFLFWWISDKYVWIPLYLLLTALLWRRFGWRNTLIMLVGFGLAVGLSDFFTSGLLKPFFARLRPSHHPQFGSLIHIVNDYRGGRYGFPSSHASDTMALGLLFSMIWKNKKATIPLMVWVAFNCYSRMYLGVHYPFDILIGLLIGSLMAWLSYRALYIVFDRIKVADGEAVNPLERS
ncbi:MAG: phosphatase PAP2 family protein [Paludibacteraceae bacterium]|nr:phosphatase PAP2 family protein [Paludibacteraceae bacterium]